ncbi:tyrosine-protein kinase Drl-like [Chrysoperla carnea]|uniref:tyrosine-protein kinase Drl-like n=1 Tax=Chrysoperla carnea TaxID=189513 RepID=UPI001D05F84C|nr:tyrosine-protein kinase Drl-like [Chrysoperla carnea]
MGLKLWWSLFSLSQIVYIVTASLNIYLDQNEVKRLFGLPAELFYVREGVLNEYALKYIVPVSAQIDAVFFSWQSLTGRTLPYEITIETSNNIILNEPQLNISTVGQIPIEPETFSVFLPCSGQAAGDVNITLNINVTFNRATNNVTSLHILRRKSCLKPDTFLTQQNNQVFIDVAPNETLSTNIFYMADACAIALILVTSIFVCAYYMRNKKSQNMNRPGGITQESMAVVQNCSSVNSASGLNRQNLHQTTFMSTVTPLPQNLFTGTSPFSHKSGSSYTSFRRVPAYTLTDEESKDLQQKITEMTVQRCRVRLRSVVLEGTFGRVYHGSYTKEDGQEEDVLVKTVTDHASQTQISLLLQEGITMYGLNHDNVLTILGVSVVNHAAPFLIYPYNGYTNLKRFLQKCKLCAEGVARTLTTQEVIDMVLQVVQGMQYLHSTLLKHKDLAARNCVVDDKLHVKITDNALSRDLFPADYHCLGDNENRPIKWLAIESLQYNLFLFQSDVWSFGVLLWEFMTLAQQPYVEIDPFEMEAYLKDGYRLAQPVNCPDELFAVMAYCWAMRTEERPSFKQLQVCLQEFYMQLTKYV